MKIGAQYVLKGSGPSDPWGINNYVIVTIVDIKGGWVRYKYAKAQSMDNAMLLDEFKHVYRPLGSDEK